jgi:hypothetical protein
VFYHHGDEGMREREEKKERSDEIYINEGSSGKNENIVERERAYGAYISCMHTRDYFSPRTSYYPL